MPTAYIWRSRRPLYRLNLVLLLALTPVNLLGMLFPYWLETKALMMHSDQGKVYTKDVFLKYGIWRLCSDGVGCRPVHDDLFDAGVGDWMYPISLLMVLSSLCHLMAALLGASQNFLPREIVRRLRFRLLKKVIHRDAPFTEDVGFLAGFFGTLSCIIFMLGTKDRISDGAHYQWAFAFCFMSSVFTVIASLTLTRTHLMSAPTPPNNNRRWRATPFDPSPDSGTGGGGGGGGGAVYLPRAAVVTEDIHLEERGGGRGGENAAQASGRTSSSTQAHSRFTSSSSSSSRRRRSRSRSRERSSSHSHSHGDSHRPRQQTSGSGSRSHGGPPRLVRSPELENIPAAVTPSSTAAAHTSSRSPSGPVPVVCLQMSDLQQRSADSTSRAEAQSVDDTAHTPVPASSSASPTSNSRCADGRAPTSSGRAPTSSGRAPTSSGRAPTSSGRASRASSGQEAAPHGVDLHRTQSEAAVVLPLDGANNSGGAQSEEEEEEERDNSVVQLSTDSCGAAAAASNVVVWERL
ncbi:uncharacterized protein LOC143295428 [Babylonia areolata]|uniref:uncharacterized protein LOC143295428 n=1 Tax=Babylonia areolata TaxID=304850 RepID=UPI003FCFB175